MAVHDKLFGCPYCGFRIGPGDERCPRCGNVFGASTKFECPFCGELVAPTMKECPTCHVDFAEFQTRVRKVAKTDGVDQLLMEIIRLEATEIGREDKKLSCPSCDLLLDGSESSCPRCGSDLTEGAAFQCPVCGEFVAPEAMTCPACGSDFEGMRSEEDRAYAEAEHEAASSALDEILSATGTDGPAIEPEPPPEEYELPPPPGEAQEWAAPPEATSSQVTQSPGAAPKKVRKLKEKPGAKPSPKA